MKKIALYIFLISITSCAKEGCNDISANNYDSEATKDDGSCTYTPSDETICYGYFPDNEFSYGNEIANYSLNDACTPVDFQVGKLDLIKLGGANFKLISEVDGQTSFEIFIDTADAVWMLDGGMADGIFTQSRGVNFDSNSYLIYSYDGSSSDTRNDGSGNLIYYITADDHFNYFNFTFSGTFNDSTVLTTNVSNQNMIFKAVVD